MKTSFEHLRQTRNNLLAFFEKHEGKAHLIPNGFNNSLYWNLAHCVVTQQLLCYKLSGNEMLISDEIVEKYRKGSLAPTDVPSDIELNQIKELIISSVDQLERDYNGGLFKQYSEYPTSYGVTLNSIEDAIQFNSLHEALHLGYMMSMVK